MHAHPYLTFNGDCADAFRFYEQTLGGEIEFSMTNAQSPMAEQTSPDRRDKIMHISMKLGDARILASDAPPHMHQPMQGMAVNLAIDDPQRADRVFAALAEGGTVKMPIQETFWAKRFGMVTDRFGTPWMVNCSKPM